MFQQFTISSTAIAPFTNLSNLSTVGCLFWGLQISQISWIFKLSQNLFHQKLAEILSWHGLQATEKCRFMKIVSSNFCFSSFMKFVALEKGTLQPWYCHWPVTIIPAIHYISYYANAFLCVCVSMYIWQKDCFIRAYRWTVPGISTIYYLSYRD